MKFNIETILKIIIIIGILISGFGIATGSDYIIGVVLIAIGIGGIAVKRRFGF